MSHTEDLDFALALRLQEEENLLANIPYDAADRPGVELTPTGGGVGGAVGGSNSQESQRHCKSASSPQSLPPPGTSLVDEAYELIDPTPDIYQLFRDFDKHFFWGKLGGVELKWSPRMTRCAGVCSYQPASGLCSVRLSRPLLMLRPRSDLVETLLHEMIHALLFVTHHNDNREEHGPEFHRHMHRINKIAGTNITVYHTFHAEVKHMLTHWWRCTGPCRSRPPHFGYVKRSMNRAPSKNDFWWRDHQASCGGLFEKIKEPEGYGKKKTKKDTASGTKLQDIRNFGVTGKAVPVSQKPPWRPAGRATAVGGAAPPVGRGRPGRGRGRGAAAGAPSERPGKRPPPEGAGPPPQRRPGHPTGVRADIGTVNNDGNQRVNAIAGNVHGFQKRGGAVATAGGSRTVTVPVRRGGAGGGDDRADGRPGDSTFDGRGNRLGGTPGVPWYKRDPPRSASGAGSAVGPTPPSVPSASRTSSATSATRTPTGIFSSPERKKPAPTTSHTTDSCSGLSAGSSLVTCPVCNEQVPQQGINDHVDQCLADPNEQLLGAVGGETRPENSGETVWYDDDDDDEQMLSLAADELERSLEVSVWSEDRDDDRLLADAADELETSLVEQETSGDDLGEITASSPQRGGSTSSAPAGGRSGAARTFSEASTPNVPVDGARGPAARTLSEASTVYDRILDEPIVIDSSDDEDYASQRANLSNVIMDFIKVEESDDELFEEL
ncbi:DNA-dependent metalloprotease SPRTN-like [Amphibalanus amphitrite]|uniref:DNA-dependent metalloprotease SPRTN-like n=1 Tax=Amphibalanus amphitrite TaxID=1232801 RepID=UPI001C910D99|nr:DNA-dependent metalloprotease SPRTN-like [Amphibalanus amphitrite]XP_043230692.1 DNA-dependent metalloprotease SPRTN-like [Amphibalanus amphitrite]